MVWQRPLLCQQLSKQGLLPMGANLLLLPTEDLSNSPSFFITNVNARNVSVPGYSHIVKKQGSNPNWLIIKGLLSWWRRNTVNPTTATS